MKKKVLTVFGTRPEAIKMAPVLSALANKRNIESQIAVTGQHREMLDQVLKIFDINPNFDLAVMRKNQSLSDVTASVLKKVEEVIKEFKPSLVLVHGDTTTTMAASLAAYFQQTAVGHVEAGLRTKDIYSPWPEEINRQVTGRIATINFAPTESAAENLRLEGIAKNKILVTGNTVVDALFSVVRRLESNPHLISAFDEALGIDENKRLVLVTGHRRESFGAGFESICDALIELSGRPDLQIIYPVHLNPKVRGPVEARLGGRQNIRLIEPQEYLQFVHLMNRSDLILTDSGGIQEEGPSLGKPVLVMRSTTERPEALTAGTVKLVGTNSEEIVSSTQSLLDDSGLYNQMSQAHNPYGDGRAAKRIADAIQSFLEQI